MDDGFAGDLELKLSAPSVVATRMKDWLPHTVLDAPAEISFCYSWFLLIVGASCMFSGDVALRSSQVSILSFLVMPSFIGALLAHLLDQRLFDCPCSSFSGFLHSLREWRARQVAMPGMCILTASDISDALIAGAPSHFSFDEEYQPFPFLLELGCYIRFSLDPLPLVTFLHDLGARWVAGQVATEAFWARCERLKRAIMSFDGTCSELNLLPLEIIQDCFGAFCVQTQWSSLQMVFLSAPTPQLTNLRVQMGGVNRSQFTAGTFYRSFGLSLVYPFVHLQLLAKRAVSSVDFCADVSKLASAYGIVHPSMSEDPFEVLVRVEAALDQRQGRLSSLCSDQSKTMAQITSELAESRLYGEGTSTADTTPTSGSFGADGTSASAALMASLGGGVATPISLTNAKNSMEFTSAELLLTPLMQLASPSSKDILFYAFSSKCLLLLQVLYNIGNRSSVHPVCRFVYSHRAAMALYFGQSMLLGFDVSLKPVGAQARLTSLCAPTLLLEQLMLLQLQKLDFINFGRYHILATETDGELRVGDWETLFFDTTELRISAGFGSKIFSAAGWDEDTNVTNSGLTYHALVSFFAGSIESNLPLVACKPEALVNFKRKTLEAYMRTMEAASGDARIKLLNNPDAQAFGRLVPSVSEHLEVYRAYLRTLSDGADFLAAFRTASERHLVGPSLHVPLAPNGPSELYMSSEPGLVGSHSHLISGDRNVLYRGLEGYSKSKLSEAFPGLCHGALLSKLGNPIATCHLAHHPDHGQLGVGAHALPSGFRKKVRRCWVRTWADYEGEPRAKGGGAEGDLTALDDSADASPSGQPSGRTPNGKGRGQSIRHGKGKGKGKGGRARGRGGRQGRAKQGF